MAFPGLVEMFDESLVVAEYYLQPAFPGLRLEYVAQNVGPAGRRAQAETREYWEDLWGEDLYRLLQRMNAMDLELVRRAKGEILRRLERIPRAAGKLAEFESRCAQLRCAAPGPVSHSLTGS
jgi:hypothetical protein